MFEGMSVSEIITQFAEYLTMLFNMVKKFLDGLGLFNKKEDEAADETEGE